MVALGVERRVAGHEEVQVGRGDERRDQTDQVVVHVRGVPAIMDYIILYTEWMEWMSHRKWKETKQQPGTAGQGYILGCCLVSLRFLGDIHSIHPVQSGVAG